MREQLANQHGVEVRNFVAKVQDGAGVRNLLFVVKGDQDGRFVVKGDQGEVGVRNPLVAEKGGQEGL